MNDKLRAGPNETAVILSALGPKHFFSLGVVSEGSAFCSRYLRAVIHKRQGTNSVVPQQRIEFRGFSPS